MKKNLLLIALLFVSCFGFAQTVTHTGTDNFTNPVGLNGNKSQLTADSAGITSTSLVATGLTLPSVASTNFSFFCDVAYNQATAAAANAFGIQATTNAPTRIDASGDVFTAAGTITSADLANLTTTTATNIVTFTPSAAGSTFHGTLKGTVQIGATAPAAIQIQALTGAGADALTIKAGSYCVTF